MRLRVTFLLSVLSLACPLASSAYNPYGVVGSDVRSILGMPADCWWYGGSGLNPSLDYQMIYRDDSGTIAGMYNATARTINNPAAFAAFISANPGKYYRISLEPDVGVYDNLTPQQWADMFKAYVDFIKPLDPTAKLINGALSGGADAAKETHWRNWYTQAINHYKANYGSPPPVDIWSIHLYEVNPYYIEFPDKPLNECVLPHWNWLKTIEGGVYANTELWITECPYANWVTALNKEHVKTYMSLLMPRLEAAGIKRFFWFAGTDFSGTGVWRDVELVLPNGQPSILGVEYARLANNYPNPVPPFVPYVPAPTPASFSDNFNDGSLNPAWMIKAGEWAESGGSLRQGRMDYFNGEFVTLQYVYKDFQARWKAKINRSAGNDYWSGISIRLANRFGAHPNDPGYGIGMRKSGTVFIQSWSTNLATITNAVSNTAVYNEFLLRVKDYKLELWVNGQKVASVTDPNGKSSDGYVALATSRLDASFEDFAIEVLSTNDSIRDIKASPKDTSGMTLQNVSVTNVIGSAFYVESLDRAAGIMCTRSAHGLVIGDKVTLVGNAKTNLSGERYLEVTSITKNGAQALLPLHMKNSLIGGPDFLVDTFWTSGQVGVTSMADQINNIGLLVRTSGRVTGAGSGYFVIDDGSREILDSSGFKGIRIQTLGTNLTTPPVGSFVTVEGNSSITKSGTSYYGQVKARSITIH